MAIHPTIKTHKKVMSTESKQDKAVQALDKAMQAAKPNYTRIKALTEKAIGSVDAHRDALDQHLVAVRAAL